MPRLMLLDAHSLIYRAYFALIETPLSTSKGQLVNAAFGFWSIVLRGFQDAKPDHVVCCFDVGRPKRAERYQAYKGTRRPTPDDLREQFPIVRETLAAFRIPMFDLEGYEADDLIGSLSLQAQAQGIESVIVSGDLDMLQLVSEHTRLMFTRMGANATIMYDPARIHERYGLAPHQMIDFKALKGDTTDNIPGLAGVGDKTAAKLLEDYGSLDGVFEHLDAVKPDKLRDKLAASRDDLLLWRDLVTIDRHAPVDLDLEAARLGDYDRAEVIRLFREYEFRTLVERLPAVDGEAPLAPGELLREADRGGPVPAAQVAGRTARAPGDGGPSRASTSGRCPRARTGRTPWRP
ncbi:MAG: 5'-3' exonuclease H3TH domain-containing protein [Chloroflexota bacterium]